MLSNGQSWWSAIGFPTILLVDIAEAKIELNITDMLDDQFKEAAAPAPLWVDFSGLLF